MHYWSTYSPQTSPDNIRGSTELGLSKFNAAYKAVHVLQSNSQGYHWTTSFSNISFLQWGPPKNELKKKNRTPSLPTCLKTQHHFTFGSNLNRISPVL